jgi:hypothetical protein
MAETVARALVKVAADQNTLIVADGFSCREQIMHNTNRRPMHLAQVIQLALHQNGNKMNTGHKTPERTIDEPQRST